MVWKTALAIAALGLTGASPSPEKIEITCRHETGEPGVVLRVDLATGEWCNARSNCARVERAVSITSGLIVLKDDRYNPSTRASEYQEVNRATGKYTFKSVGSITFGSVQDCSATRYAGEIGQTAKF